MISGIDSQQIQQLQQFQQTGKAHGHHKGPQDMFANLNKLVGGDGTGITKDQLQTAAEKALSDGNDRDVKMLNKVISDFEKLSGGADKITASSIQQVMQLTKAQFAAQASQVGQTSGQAGCSPCSGCGRCNNGTQQTPDSVTKAQLQSPIDLNII